MRQLLRLLAILCLVLGVFAAKKNAPARPTSSAGGKRVVCYYTNWSVYRPGTAKFTPQNINPYLCTHLIYAFGGLTRENGLRPFDKYQDVEQGGYAKFTGLKTYNKDLKTMLAIGGWNEGSARFSPLVAEAEKRKEFVKNVLRFLRQNHFDGLDLDWEYPAFRDGGKTRDKGNYALLVKELREEFDRESDKTGRSRLLLTMAVPAGIEYIDKGFDITSLNKYLDFMNILSYDYHSAFEPAVNHHSPLYSMEEDDEYNFDAQLTIDHTVNHYMKSGADRNKLVLGIPTYGRSYTLFNPLATELGSPADGPGEQGDSTREKGYLAYYEICENLENDDWKVVQPNPKAMGPYAYKGNQWVSYDDMDIIKKKAQYVNDNGLGGIMFWAIDNDDFRGKCHGRPYPLIEAGKEAMMKGIKRSNNEIETTPTQNNRQSSRKRNRNRSKNNARGRLRTTASTSTVTTTTTTTTTTTATPPATPSYTTPEPPTTPDPGSDFKCVDEGFFPHPRDCKKYFWCLDSGPSNLGIVAHQFTCPSGLFFNKAADSCDYARNVVCNKKSKTQGGSSSTLPPIKAATSSTTRFSTSPSTILTTKLTTTTTTESPALLDDDSDELEEEEEEDEYHDYDSNSEEDPQALKELINLIKKLGGVEQLEKQLNLQNSDQSGERKGTGTTPAVSRNLYNRIVSYNTARSLGSGGLTTPAGTTTPRYTSSFQNRPERPQNAGLEKIEEIQALRREKPTYVTIRRERPSTREPLIEESVEDDDKKILSSSEEDELEEDDEYIDEDENPEIKSDVKAPFKEYITIQRSRPVTASSDDTEDSSYQQPSSGVQQYSSPQRNRLTTTSVTENSSPRYVTISRVRSTTESNTINFEDGSNRDISSLLNSDDTTAAGRDEQEQSKVQTTTPVTPPTSAASDELKGQPRQNHFQLSTKRVNVLTVSSPPIFESAEQTTKFAEEDGNIPINSDNSAGTLSATVYNTEESTTKSFRQFKTRPTVATTTPIPDTSSETTTRTRTRPGSERRRFRPKVETTTSSSESLKDSTETVKDQQRRFRPKTEATTVSEVTEKSRPRFRPKPETTTGTPVTEQRRRPQNNPETGSEEDALAVRSSQSKAESSEEEVTERLRRFRPRTEASREIEVVLADVTPGSTTAEHVTFVPEGLLKPKLSTSQVTDVTESSVLGATSGNTAKITFTATAKRENNNLSQDNEFLSSYGIKTTSPITTVEEGTERSTEHGLTSTAHISSEKVITIQGTKEPATEYSPRYRDFSTVRPTELLSTLQYSTVDDKQPVLSTSQHLLQTGIAEVTSSQAFSTTESVSEYTRSTSDGGSYSENTSVPASKSTADASTTPLQTTGRRRGTPKVVRRRKFGSGGRNSTVPAALENGTRPRKFNFPRRPVLVNSTADKDMDLLESMDHLARDKPGLDNLLLPTQVTVAQPQGLSKATDDRKTSKFVSSGRTTLASLAARRATLSLSTTPIQSGFTTAFPGAADIHQQQNEDGSPVTQTTVLLDSVAGPRAIFPQESGIIHPIRDHSLSAVQTKNNNGEPGDYGLKELSSPSDLSTPTASTVRELTSKYSESSYGESPHVVTVTEIPSQSPQIFSTLRDDTTEPGLSFQSSKSSEYPAELSGDKTKSSYFTTERPRTSILFRSRNRGRGKFPLRSQETGDPEPLRTTTVLPKRGLSVTPPTSTSTKEAPTRSRSKPFSKINRPKGQTAQRTSTHSVIDYEYYDDDDSAILDVAPLSEKVKIHSDGYIECLDQGNFPHPFSCKKFISCAKMENGELLGWEYTCPRQLSFDPIGGICNWSAGLGCKE